MKRFMYKFRRHNKVLQILGVIMLVIGLILVLKIIPAQLWLFILGLVLIIMGWFFFRIQ